MNNNAETALLSCILQDPAVVGSEVLATFQRANPFSDDMCRRVYSAWARLANRSTAAMPELVDKLENSGYACDWFMEVRSIYNHVPHSADWRSYLSIVRTEYVRKRALAELGEAQSELARSDDVAETLNNISKKLISIDAYSETDEVDIRHEVSEEMNRLNSGVRYSTGISAVDEIIGPMEPGEVFTIAASTGVGKSLLAANIVRHLSLMNNIPGLYFSFEMNPAKHVARIVASMTDNDSRRVLSMYRDGNEEVVNAYNRVYDCPIIWDKRPRLTPQQICNKIRRCSATHEIKFVIIDTLDFVKHIGATKKNEAIGEFLKDFKAVCVECSIIPILLVQINRSAKESEKGIGLHHLKDSSAIEQDSSQVLLLDREITLTAEERELVNSGNPIGLKAAGAKSRYDMTGYRQLALFLHSSLIQSKAYNEQEMP